MIRKGSLVRFVGHRIHLETGKMYSVHDVKGEWAKIWVPKNGKWMKTDVRLDDLELIVE